MLTRELTGRRRRRRRRRRRKWSVTAKGREGKGREWR